MALAYGLNKPLFPVCQHRFDTLGHVSFRVRMLFTLVGVIFFHKHDEIAMRTLLHRVQGAPIKIKHTRADGGTIHRRYRGSVLEIELQWCCLLFEYDFKAHQIAGRRRKYWYLSNSEQNSFLERCMTDEDTHGGKYQGTHDPRKRMHIYGSVALPLEDFGDFW